MRPLFGNVLVQPVTQQKTDSGLYLPQGGQQEAVQKGKIIACGSGSLASDGSLIPMEVQPGDTVLYKTYGVYKIKHNNEDHLVLDQRDILMVV